MPQWRANLVPGPVQLDFFQSPKDGLFRFDARAVWAGEARAGEIGRLEKVEPSRREPAAEQHDEAADRFRMLVESVSDCAIAVLDAEGRVASWNVGAVAITGYEPHEVLGRSFAVFYPDEGTPNDFRVDLRTAKDSGRHQSEGWRVRKDGTRFWAGVSLTALRGPDSSLLGFGLVMHDGSAQQALQEQLRASEERFHELVDAATDCAIFRLDANGCVATWNAGARKTKGYEAADILGQHFSIFYSPEDKAIGRPDQILATVRREGRYEEEGWRVRKDGSRFWANVIIRALRSPDGTVTGFAKVTRDLTERKFAEESKRRLAHEQLARAAAETERQRLLELLQRAPAVTNFLRGPTLVIEVAHPRLVEAAGGRRIVGKSLAAAFPELRDSPLAARLRAVYESGEPARTHEQPPWFGSTGTAEDAYWNSVYLPVRDVSGAVVGVMTFDLDVTESVRTRRALERANHAKDDFLATMSHELRTPLNALLGWVEILRKKPATSANIQHGLAVIERNARAQARIVGDLLDVSRVVSGKFQLSLRPTDIAAVLRAAIDVVRPAANGKGVELALRLPEALGEMLADPDRLQQIAWNLLSNAVRHTPKGGRVTVSVARSVGALELIVKDTGAGIAPDDLGRIFERFHQVDSTVTRHHRGLGLGLAIVRHLAEAHGGSVSASSEGLGKGATFNVSIPLRALDAPATEGNHSVLEGSAGGDARRLGGLRVWVVDDDGDSLDVAAVTLRAAGATVTAFRTATEVLAAQGECDVLVSDIGMPVMDGYSLLHVLRTRGTDSGIRAIALTAFAGPLDSRRAVAAGFHDYLTKPIHPSALVEAVRRSAPRPG